MGQRANYVLVEEGGWSLFYSHWAANTIDRDLIWGPDHAIAFVRAQQPTAEWLDDVWCEGGALVDLPRRLLLLFGGEDIRFDVLSHRLTLALMRRAWQGWEVRWAFEGLGDVVDYLGPRALVRSGRPDDEPRGDLPVGGPWTQSVLSVRGAGGALSLVACDVDACDIVEYPPSVVDRLVGHGAITLPLHGAGAPSSGAHLDVAARRVHLWAAGFCQDLSDQVARRWIGWELVHHGADFESQIALTEGALTMTAARQEEVEREIATYLLGSSTFDPAKTLSALRAARPDASIEVNPPFFTHRPHEVPADERARMLTRILAGLPRQPGFMP